MVILMLRYFQKRIKIGKRNINGCEVHNELVFDSLSGARKFE